MSLIDCMSNQCEFMIPHREPDSAGGYITTWTPGERITAAIIRDTSTEAKIAEATGTVKAYTVTVNRNVHLKYHDVIRRLSDGAVFRITSDNSENQTPYCATLNMAQSTAEAWRLTT